jgi:hypothetical protein
MLAPTLIMRRGLYADKTAASQIRSGSVTLSYVRFGSKADMCSANSHVRFTPKSGQVRCISHVRFVPIADIIGLFDHFVSRQKNAIGYSGTKCFGRFEIDY